MRGIYAITNILTDTVYYGQSGFLTKRLGEHRLKLSKNIHANPKLQSSWNKYGKDAFVFTPIQIIEDTNIDLTPIEKKYKDGAYSLGLKIFNILEPGNPPMSGRHHTQEAKTKIAKGNKNKILSDFTKSKIAKANKNKIVSNETKKKLSDINKGKKYRLGFKTSEETKKKLSELHTGIPCSEEAKKKFSDLYKGKNNEQRHIESIIRKNETRQN